MKSALLTLMSLSFFVMASAQNYPNVSETDTKEFYALQKKFPKLVKEIEAKDCCIGSAELNDITFQFYKKVSEFITTGSPGFNLDSLQTRQIVFLLHKLDYLLGQSIKLQSPILSGEFQRKSGFVWYDYLFLVGNINDVIAQVETDE